MIFNVKYTEGECHPRAYKSNDCSVNYELSNVSKRLVEVAVRRKRYAHPRWIIDWHYAGGRVVVCWAKKRWYERS